MSQSMIATSLLCVLISVAIAVCAIGYFTFQLVVGEKGKARVDVLQQISDSNSVKDVYKRQILSRLPAISPARAASRTISRTFRRATSK